MHSRPVRQRGELLRARQGRRAGGQQLAQAYRFTGRLDKAIELYGAVIGADAANDGPFRMRAAYRMQQAAHASNRDETVRLTAQAIEDYREAQRINREDEENGVCLLEVEVCCRRVEAIETTRTLWPNLRESRYRIICAWLGAIAGELAGQPSSEHADYIAFLRGDETTLLPATWSVVEIEALIARLKADPTFDRARLARIEKIHRLFLAHFGEEGPAIRATASNRV